MGQVFVGQLLLVPYNFAPQGWMFCQGQLLPISENETLFNLIGTTYGGDGQETFALPDLRGRVPVGFGTGQTGTSYIIGQTGGVETVTLNVNQIPIHTHQMFANGAAASSPHAGNNTVAVAAGNNNVYHPGAPAATTMNAQMATQVGGSQPHDNMQPYLTLNWIISLFGIFPSQT